MCRNRICWVGVGANIVLFFQGLCEEGGGGKMVDEGNNTYGGRYVVNPSGGLISKGHPLGATGLAQCAELNWQVREERERERHPVRTSHSSYIPNLAASFRESSLLASLK